MEESKRLAALEAGLSQLRGHPKAIQGILDVVSTGEPVALDGTYGDRGEW